MSEISATLQWIQQASNAAGITAIYRGAAPAGSIGPYTRVTFYGGLDVAGVHGVRLWSRNRWLVEVWGLDDGFGSLDATAKTLDTALHDKHSVGVTDGMIVSSVRDEPRMGQEEDGNLLWTHIGGIYTIEAQSY